MAVGAFHLHVLLEQRSSSRFPTTTSDAQSGQFFPLGLSHNALVHSGYEEQPQNTLPRLERRIVSSPFLQIGHTTPEEYSGRDFVNYIRESRYMP